MATTETRSRQTLTAMLHRHESERRELADALLAEQRDQGDRLLGAINPEVGAALAEAVDQIERQVRKDQRAGTLRAKVEPSLAAPGWANEPLPSLDADEVSDGRRPVVIYVPPRYADGHQQPTAVAMFDCTDAVFGKGASARRDRAADDLQQAQAGRDAEIERERVRDALRR